MGLLTRLDRHADLVGRMADTLGVDLVEAAQRGDIGEGSLRNAVHTCMGCTQPGACESWLDAHSQGASETPDFCRNKAMLDRMATR